MRRVGFDIAVHGEAAKKDLPKKGSSRGDQDEYWKHLMKTRVGLFLGLFRRPEHHRVNLRVFTLASQSASAPCCRRTASPCARTRQNAEPLFQCLDHAA